MADAHGASRPGDAHVDDRPPCSGAQRQQAAQRADENFTMNISTHGYAPSDGMRRPSYARDSYYSHRQYAGSGSGSSGSHSGQFNVTVPLDGVAPSDGHHQLHQDRAMGAMGVGFDGPLGSGAFAEDTRPLFPPPALPGSGSYHPSRAYHHHHQGGSGTGGGYGYPHGAAHRMHQELGMYGGNYGPAVPWYQHPAPHHHQQHPHEHTGYQQHHHGPHEPHHHSHHQPAAPRCYPMPPEHMYSMFNFNRNGREARNRAEKNRRDKLNGSIQELSAMVPHVAESPRRVDKTAVLRFSAHGLRVDYVFGKSKPEETFKPEAQDSLFRMLNGFLLTVTCRGQIVLVSPSVEQFLGHCQTDLYGQNLFNLTHPDDHALLKQQLVPSNLINLFDGAGPPGSGPTGSAGGDSGTTVAVLSPARETHIDEQGKDGESGPRSQHDEEEEIDRKLRMDSRKFTIRMARAGPRSEATTYELVTIDGCFRRADLAPRGTAKPGVAASGMQMIRRARGRDDAIPLHSINGNDIVFIGLARVMKMPSICDRLIEACKYEYKTRHLIDGRIVQCDQRISIVAGYLTDEVSGLSPFTFMHRDDVRWVIVALRQMYDYNQNGESCYRLMARTGDFIYLKTRGYLEVDSDTKVVQSFVCINTLVSEEEGQRLVREMKRKFSVIVDKVELPDESGEPVVENPKQIEEAVMNLITNLQPDSEDKLLSTMPASPAGSIKSGYGDGLGGLAIVAPEKNSIKSAIVKSINVVSIASKTIREARGSPGDWSPLNGDQQSSNESSSTGTTGMVSPGGPSEEPMSPSQAVSPSPGVPGTTSRTTFSTALSRRATVLQKHEPASPQPSCSSNVEQRVPPLPNSEHYFTQPFSPSGGSGTVPTSVLSPASAQHSNQRNARSPLGPHCGVPSPPANAFPRAGDGTPASQQQGGGGQNRTTSVLKRTYSNSSISSLTSSDNFGEFNGNPADGKRCKTTDSPDLSSCFNELINPASDLTSFLPNSFDALDQSLLSMETTTTIIREQVSSYPDLHESQNQLERIVEEHQEQREMLQSIQEEFQMQFNGGGSRARQGHVAGGVTGNGSLVTVTTTTSHLVGGLVKSDAIFCTSAGSPTASHVRQAGSVITPNVVRTAGSTLGQGS